MSENKAEIIVQQLSPSQILSISFSKYAKLFYIWIFYLVAYLLMAVTLLILDPYIPTSLDNTLEQYYVLFDKVFTTQGTIDQVALSQLQTLTPQILFISINEHMLATFFLSFAYFFTIMLLLKELKSDPQFSKTAVVSGVNPSPSVPQEVKTITYDLSFAKLIPFIIVMFLYNLLVQIGTYIFFFIPGLILAVLFAVAPIAVLEGNSILESFSRAKSLASKNFLKIAWVLIIVGFIQSIIDGIIQTVIALMLPADLTVFGIPQQFGELLIAVFSASFLAPLTIISLIFLHIELNWQQMYRATMYGTYGAPKYPQHGQPYTPPQSRPQTPPIYGQPTIPQTPPLSTSDQPNLEKGKRCPNCGALNPDVAQYCAFCGTKLPSIDVSGQGSEGTTTKVCKNCGRHAIKDTDKFCPYCGELY